MCEEAAGVYVIQDIMETIIVRMYCTEVYSVVYEHVWFWLGEVISNSAPLNLQHQACLCVGFLVMVLQTGFVQVCTYTNINKFSV